MKITQAYAYRATCGASGVYIPEDGYAIEGYSPQGTICGDCSETSCICQYASIYEVCGWDAVLDALRREYGEIEVA